MCKLRALVLGGNGFLGRQLAAELLKTGNETLVVGSSQSFNISCEILKSMGYGPPPFYKIKSLEVGILREVLSTYRPNVVFNMIGGLDRTDGFELWDNLTRKNVLTTSTVISAIASLDLAESPILITAGSQMEYGISEMPWSESNKCKPINAYGASKLLSTELVLSAIRSNSIRACVLRLPLVYGPGQTSRMLIPEVMVKCLNCEEVLVTSGIQKRRILHSQDAVKMFIEIASLHIQKRDIPSLLNAPASYPISIKSLSQTITAIAGTRELLKIGALPDRRHEMKQAWPETSLAESLFQQNPIDIELGLKDVFEWYKNNRWFTANSP